MKKYYNGHRYSTGAFDLKKNELAWTQETGNEAIIRPTDNAILTPIKIHDSILNPDATKNLVDILNNPSMFIAKNFSTQIPNIAPLSSTNTKNTIENQNIA